MISGGAWYCQLFAIDVKGGGKAKQQRVPIRLSEDDYFHQCQRGRLLEIFSLMAKDVAKELACKCSRKEQRKNEFTETRSEFKESCPKTGLN